MRLQKVTRYLFAISGGADNLKVGVAMFQAKEGIIKPIVYVGILRDQKLLLVDYVESPNPERKGWWIPAPELKFGEDPVERAEKTVKEMGFSPEKLKLFDVESFVLPGGWHLLYHFICEVNGDVGSSPLVKDTKWVSENELMHMSDIAHGKWEINVGRKYLEAVS